MFVAAYKWSVRPGQEEQFCAAWRRGTRRIAEKYGSCGSRLHRTVDGDFIGEAQWPDTASWRAAIVAKLSDDDCLVEDLILGAIAQSDDHAMFLMEVTHELLTDSY